MAVVYERNRVVIEALVRGESRIPFGTHTVQVGMDRVMVPMEGEETKPRAARRTTRSLHVTTRITVLGPWSVLQTVMARPVWPTMRLPWGCLPSSTPRAITSRQCIWGADARVAQGNAGRVAGRRVEGRFVRSIAIATSAPSSWCVRNCRPSSSTLPTTSDRAAWTTRRRPMMPFR